MQEKRTNLYMLTLSKLFKHGFSQLIFAISLLGVLIIVNYLVASKTSYVDITRNKVNSLSVETKNLLKEINYPLTIKAFYLSSNQHYINLLLSLYQNENKSISIEFIDPIKNPLMAEDYGVSLPKTIIFEAQGRTSILKPPTPGKQNNERDISLALYRFITDQTRKIYFSIGHGEPDISNNEFDGLSIVRDRLLEQNYLVETINLKTVSVIPSDCAVLVIADPEPRTPFTDEEESIVEEYQKNGGNIFVLLSPGLMPNLENVMKLHGVIFGSNFIYETSKNRTTEMGPTAPLCAPLDQSEITASITNQNILFPSARSVLAGSIGDLEVTRLLASSENSWAETDIEAVSSGKQVFRDENEIKGPVPVALTTQTEIAVYDTTMMTPPTRNW